MKLYLSKLLVNLSCRDVYMNIQDSNSWHKKVMSGFSDIKSYTPRKDLGVLFRLTKGRTGIEVLVQSYVEPDWKGIEWVASYEVKETTEILDSFQEGQVVGFDVLCAAYRKNSFSGKRYPMYEEKAAEWLMTKGNSHGFNLDIDSLCVLDKYDKIEGIGELSGDPILLTRFTGHMTITNLEHFKKCYTEGIGREKSYGAGMLLLSR